MAHILFVENKYDRADSLYQVILTSNLGNPDRRHILQQQAYISSYRRNHEQADSLLKVAEKISLSDSSHELIADYHYTLGYSLRRQYLYDSAVVEFQKAYQLDTMIFGAISERAAKDLRHLGRIYNYDLADYNKALQAHKKELNIRETLSKTTELDLSQTYYYLSIAQRFLTNYDQALEYLNAGYNYYLKDTTIQNTAKANYLFEFGNTHMGFEYYDEAIDYYQQAIHLAQTNLNKYNLDLYLSNLSVAFNVNKDFEEADSVLNLSWELVAEKNYHQQYYILSKRIDNFLDWDRPDSAAVLIQKYEGIVNKHLGGDSFALSELAHLKGRFSELIQQYTNALKYYLVSLQDQIEIREVQMVPHLEKVKFNTHVQGKLADIARICFKIGDQKKDFGHMQLAVAYYQLIDSLMTFNDYFVERESELHSLDQHHRIYIEAMECLYTMDSISHDKQYIEVAFGFMEKMKGRRMSRFVRSAILKNAASGVLAQLIEKDQVLEKYSMISPLNISKEISLLRPRLRAERDSLLDLLPEREFQLYSSARERETATIDDALSYGKKENSYILNYITDDQSLFCILIEDGTTFYQLDLDSAFHKNYDKFYYELTERENLFDRSGLLNFVEASGYLRQQLLPRDLLDGSRQKLIISPDGFLAHFPWAALLTEVPEENNAMKTYDQLAYLVEEMPFHLAPSLTLYFHDRQREKTIGKERILAFSYAGSADAELTGTYKEVQSLKSAFKDREVKVFSGDEATKENFLKNYRYYDVLYFALHASVNSEQRNSKLQFIDSDMYSQEFINLDLVEKTLVLSACETGNGYLRQGEGIESLALAMKYAGAFNIIFTVSPISDIVSSIAHMEIADLDELSLTPGSHKRLQHPGGWSLITRY